jgi:hypothetical protein
MSMAYAIGIDLPLTLTPTLDLTRQAVAGPVAWKSDGRRKKDEKRNS